jgi:hypothetical protein
MRQRLFSFHCELRSSAITLKIFRAFQHILNDFFSAKLSLKSHFSSPCFFSSTRKLDAAFKHMRHLIPISGTHVERSGDEILLKGHFEELSDLGRG